MTPDDFAPNPHYSSNRKIDPARRKPDGTPADNDRVEIGPTDLAFAEWAEAGLEAPNLASMRAFRLARLVEALRARDLDGVLLSDPLNIRYASDTTNMQLWNAHNPFRACLVTADGWMIVWDYKASDLLTAFNPLVRETRGGASFFYFVSGDKNVDDAKRFAAEVDDVLRERLGAAGTRRLAVDKILPHGLHALEALGLTVTDGEELMERTRAVKGPDEIKAMRCAMHACERAVAAMEAAVAPNLSESEIWAVLHAENIRRGGEWIETRILNSGPRTNPWFQECGPRIVEAGDLLAFDTDLIGCYGMCADISRTWLVGDGDPTAEQIRLYRIAHEHVETNVELVRPGATLKELTFGGHMLPDEFVEQRYGVKFHGVGLCDEWPSVMYPEDWRAGAFDHALEPGMMLCVEVYLGAKGGRDGIKLENQVLVTEDGYESLTNYPYDARLLG